MEVEGDVNNDTHWPLTLENSYSPSWRALYTDSLLFVVKKKSDLVKKQPLCRLYVPGSFKKLVGARQVLMVLMVLMVPGPLAC